MSYRSYASENAIRSFPGGSIRSHSELYLSVITILEIEKGIERQRTLDPPFAEQLIDWLEQTRRAFGDRILPLTVNIARRWGRLAAHLGNKELDLAIAATALEHGLTIVTGNTNHFECTGASILNPFHAKGTRP
jgi:hypothetical protein